MSDLDEAARREAKIRARVVKTAHQVDLWAAADLNYLLAALDEARRVRNELGAAYREAIGVPESRHQRERMESIARALEESQSEVARLRAERDEARAEVQHVSAARAKPLLAALDREARARKAAESAVAAVREVFRDFYLPGGPTKSEALTRIRAALATPTTTEETRPGPGADGG